MGNSFRISTLYGRNTSRIERTERLHSLDERADSRADTMYNLQNRLQKLSYPAGKVPEVARKLHFQAGNVYF